MTFKKHPSAVRRWSLHEPGDSGVQAVTVHRSQELDVRPLRGLEFGGSDYGRRRMGYT
jgi:hypothetical protein